jgi:hypothetical protein
MDTDSNLVYPLPRIRIDSTRLLSDLSSMEESLWTLQNRYKSDITHWDGISLYSVSGDIHDLRCADRLPVHKTPAGERCTYVCNELLPQFGAPWLRVVFYRLKAGTVLGEHRDIGENRMTAGLVRIHVPIITDEKVLMYVGGKPYYFPVGTAWYFDATARHRVENNSHQDRIHLVIDLKTCDALETFLKPLTAADRTRLLYLGALSHVYTLKTFLKFIWTSEGRARIRARAAVIFR